MATKACAQDDVRYAMDAKRCPECGSTKAYEAGSPEHLAALEVADQVPDGAAEKVLDWVGEDTERAARALEVEQRKDKPRTTLLDQLAKLPDQADEVK